MDKLIQMSKARPAQGKQVKVMQPSLKSWLNNPLRALGSKQSLHTHPFI